MDGKVNLNFCVESALGIDVVWFDRVERWWESMEIFFLRVLGFPKLQDIVVSVVWESGWEGKFEFLCGKCIRN